MRRVRDLQPVHRQGDRGQDHRAGQEPQQRGAVPPRLARADPVRVRSEFLNPAGQGAVRKGVVVSSIVNFGAFVDLGGSTTWSRLRAVLEPHRPSRRRLSRVGDEVTVEVLDVDMDRGRVSLSLKGDPGRSVAALVARTRHRADRARQGRKLVPFGAFVRVGASRPGAHLRARPSATSGFPIRWWRRRRRAGQGHRHRPGASPDLAEPQAGPTRTTPGVRPVEVRHGRQLRRGWQPSSLRASTPRQ